MSRISFRAEMFIINKQLEQLKTIYHELENADASEIKDDRIKHLQDQIVIVKERVQTVLIKNVLESSAMRSENGVTLLIELMKQFPAGIEKLSNKSNITKTRILRNDM